MSKKRLAASLLVVLFGILANILVFRYEPALSEKKVTVKVTLTSDELYGDVLSDRRTENAG